MNWESLLMDRDTANEILSPETIANICRASGLVPSDLKLLRTNLVEFALIYYRERQAWAFSPNQQVSKELGPIIKRTRRLSEAINRLSDHAANQLVAAIASRTTASLFSSVRDDSSETEASWLIPIHHEGNSAQGIELQIDDFLGSGPIDFR